MNELTFHIFLPTFAFTDGFYLVGQFIEAPLGSRAASDFGSIENNYIQQWGVHYSPGLFCFVLF
jgi:hypothetical protein